MKIRVATDIGGTFTDLVWLGEQGALGVSKTSTTPRNFAQGVMEAISSAAFDLRAVTQFVHGTTVVINAITERKGVRTALVTTQGFRDVLAIGRANRPDMYNFRFQKPPPLVPRYLRLEVSERLGPDGQVVRPLEESSVLAAAEVCRREGVEAVAVCLLHSYANAEHERRCAQILAEQLSGVYISISSDLSQEWREYERSSTVVLNAYVQPIAERYLDALEQRLQEAGMAVEPHAMQSNGGTSTFRRCRSHPVHLLESGPVAGVMGAALVGQAVDVSNVISLDIGGTTAKTSLIERGEVRSTTDYRLERTPHWPGYPVQIPVVDIVEIGAGGGSIAWTDQGGALRVGPQSAGAEPGPACYAKGGTAPTVTDACLVLGWLNPHYFLGGELKVDLEAARRALEPVAERYHTSLEEAALGVVRITQANMTSALKLVSVQRGYDPREFLLVAFGGGGPMHAGALAEELHIPQVLIPRLPGHFSAWGMLACDARHDFVQTEVLALLDADLAHLTALYQRLERDAAQVFAQEGMPRERITFVRAVDLRYRGQEHTVQVPVPAGKLTITKLQTVAKRFQARHLRQYTFKLEDTPIEAVSFHLTALGAMEKPPIAPFTASGQAEKGQRTAYFAGHGPVQVPVFERDGLRSGRVIQGPAIVEEPAATTVVFPGQSLEVDRYSNLILTTQGERE